MVSATADANGEEAARSFPPRKFAPMGDTWSRVASKFVMQRIDRCAFTKAALRITILPLLIGDETFAKCSIILTARQAFTLRHPRPADALQLVVPSAGSAYIWMGKCLIRCLQHLVMGAVPLCIEISDMFSDRH